MRDECNYKGEEFPIDNIPSNGNFKTILDLIESDLRAGKVISAKEISNKSPERNGIKNLITEKFAGFQNTGKGVYVYSKKLNNGEYKPVYVGISKTIFDRIRGQLARTDKETATLALKIAKFENYLSDKEKDSTKIKNALTKVQSEYLHKLWVTAHPFQDDSNFLLPMLEIYLSVKLRAFWNTFETH